MRDRSEAEASGTWLLLFRLTVLIALGVSGALYAQYLNPAEASFCGVGSGCDELRRSAFGYFGSRYLSLPMMGVLGYAAVLAVSVLTPDSDWVSRLASLGGVFGVALVAVQTFHLHVFCSLCVAVDGAAIAAAVFAWVARRTGSTRALDPFRPWAWALVAVVAATAPLVWTQVKPAPPIPTEIRALYRPGAINVVEFADFECPFCRKLHPVLKRVLKDFPKVHFVRKHVPLESHEHALPAARAVVCAEEQGKGETLADRLVEIELSGSAVRGAALQIGVDAARFEQCLASAAPDRRVEADTHLLESAGMLGLPTTYVGGERLLGLVSEPKLRDALERAARGESETGLPAWLFAALALGLVSGAAWLGRTPRGKLQYERT